MYRPSIPYNITNWKIFDNDVQILDFLIARDTFKDFSIYEVEHYKSLSDNILPSNIIPMLVLNLERNYDLQDKFKGNPKCKTQSSTLNHKTANQRYWRESSIYHYRPNLFSRRGEGFD